MKRLTCSIVFLMAVSVYADKIRVITPYAGLFHNDLSISNQYVDLQQDDAGVMEGLFFQCVDPGKMQWNLFLYGAQDVNSSDVIGGHFIYDRFLKHTEAGRYAIGLGFDFIQIKTGAGVFDTVEAFSMTNRISAPFARAGRYFDFKQGVHRHTVFIWAGYECDMIRGDIGFDVPMPPHIPNMPPVMPQEIGLDEDYNYGLAGFALQTRLYHFLDIKLKYHKKISMDDGESYDVLSLMGNVFLNRQWGVSYRFKQMDVPYSKNSYHIGGLIYIF